MLPQTAFFVKVFKYLSWPFWSCFSEVLDKKVKINFKIYDVKNWKINNYNTYIAQYFKKYRQSENQTWSVDRI